MKYNFYPFSHSGLVLQDKNKTILRTDLNHLCGYVALHKSKIPKKWHGDYDADALQYLNIHGGITFCKEHDKYIVFGFDCAHVGDEDNVNLKDQEYVMDLVNQMEFVLLEYAKVIVKWRNASRKARAKMIDKIHDKCEIKSKLGFGAMIGMLSGASEFDK